MTAARDTSEQEGPPRVWVVRDDRPGNATQSRGLAEALGWPFEIKTLRCSWLSSLHNRLLGASLLGIDRSQSSPLEPPWPDLVIASGRRTAPVAQWIRKQSGGRARIVTLGRKAGDAADQVDLAITPKYCRCSPHPNRFVTRAPLHLMTRQALDEAREEWRDILGSGSCSPRIAVLV